MKQQSEIENTQVRDGIFRRFLGCFSLDLRSLAVFRIGIGIMLLWDLALRFPTWEMMVSDQGAVTRETVQFYWSQFIDFAQWPLFNAYQWNGDPTYSWVLFWLTAASAAMFLVGFQTRLAAIACWALLLSLHARNPMILSSGDMIMRLLLMWSIFLPLGRVWSMDQLIWRGSDRAKPQNVANVASLGFLLQFAFMYFFTGVGKFNDVWLNGHAMQYVLQLDIYVNETGRSLLQYTELNRWVTWATLWGEIGLPLCLLIPFKNWLFRLLNILIFAGMHVGIAITMNIGLFPYICMVCWLALLPSEFWVFLFGRSAEPEPTRAKAPAARQAVYWLGSAVGSLLIIFVLIWNINNHQLQRTGKPILHQRAVALGYYLMLDQYFLMFDRPPTHSPWFVYEARLASGRQVDLLTNALPSDSRADGVMQALKYHHVRKLHRNLVTTETNVLLQPTLNKFRTGLGEYYVSSWNEQHPQPEDQIHAFRLICTMQLIDPQASEPENEFNRQVQIWYAIEPAGDLFEQELEKLLNDELTIF